MKTAMNNKTASVFINKFYDGTISPDELTSLTAFLKAHRHELPEPMAAEADMLIALSSLSHPRQTLTPPEDLEEKIDKTLGFSVQLPETGINTGAAISSGKSERRRKRFLSITAATGIAAAVAILLTTANNSHDSSMASISRPGEKNITTAPHRPTNDDSSYISISPTVRSATEFVASVTAKPGEVTDIERGKEITAGALQILNRNLSVAHGSLASINGNFTKCNNHLKKIFHKKTIQ